jgi:hypothetical protein
MGTLWERGSSIYSGDRMNAPSNLSQFEGSALAIILVDVQDIWLVCRQNLGGSQLEPVGRTGESQETQKKNPLTTSTTKSSRIEPDTP